MHNIIRRFNCTAFFVVIFLVSAIYLVKIAEVVYVETTAANVAESTEEVTSTGDGPQQQQLMTAEEGVVVQTQNWKVVDDPLVMGDKFEHLMWFMQITDLHISAFLETSRIEQFKEFCAEDVFAIKPSVVLASGDLTNGRLADTYGSRQLEEEWRTYHDIVWESGVTGVTQWLDVRGNHDNFDVLSQNSSQNFFLKYSVQGAMHAGSYSYQVKQGGDRYSFIAVNACLEPGPRLPFNVVGLLTQQDMANLAALDTKSRRSNMTIWFGHYPTSSILSPSPGVRHLMRHGHAYMCGHYHTLNGWVPRMYTKQKSGFLELELGDWRDSRLYRVAAVDHGLLTLVDVRHGSWPVVVVTNPKNSLFLLGDREPIHRMIRSTHIRLLAFSTVNITEVSVSVDDGSWQPCGHVEGPLYVLPWKADDYKFGLHRIRVWARDQMDRERVHSQSFSLDGSQQPFDLLSQFFLMNNMVTVAQVVLGLSVFLTVLPLCCVRLMHHYVLVGKLARPRFRNACSRAIVRKLWLVASFSRIFYPVVLLNVYVPLGPWFVGNVLSDHVGVCFAWGMFVNGYYLPGGFSFVFATFHMWVFNVPIVILLAVALDHQYAHLADRPCPGGLFCSFLRHIPFTVFFCVNAFLTYLFYPSFGAMAFLLNPLKTWSLLVALVLWALAAHLPMTAFRSVLLIFPPRRRSPPIIICQEMDKEASIALGRTANY